MADIEMYSNAYGHKLQVRTWQTNIATASSVAIQFKNLSTDATTSLTATVVTSYPAGTFKDPIQSSEYAVEVTFPLGWGTTRVGRWVCNAVATFPSAVIPGEAFFLEVITNPTA